jgi:pimeloyl-ACP methyl ester carboxylesterase
MPLTDFVEAEPPVELAVTPPPAAAPGVLSGAEQTGEEVGAIEFEPDPGEQAAYALIHEVYTPEGMIFDISLPQRVSPAAAPGVLSGGPVLGGSGSERLHFPVRRMNVASTPPDAPGSAPPGVLGGVGDIVSTLGGEQVVRHILRLVKAPVERTFQQAIAGAEGQPRVVTIEPDDKEISKIATPLLDAEAWRSQFDPAKEHRVLLFIPGFASTVQSGMPRMFIKEFYGRYDGVLGYDHPTISSDPVQNAMELLAQVPDDVKLNVDVLAHSRGGLVARSVAELQPRHPKLNIQRVVTFGTPHGGTVLAQQERWDRLLSIAFTALSWVTVSTGAGATIAMVPKVLEVVLRSGSQFFFDLPGVLAMAPESAFLQRLNASSDLSGLVYAAVLSNFNPAAMPERSIRDGLVSMAASAFLEQDNDLVVTTESMKSIDLGGGASPLGERIYTSDVSHFGYFSRNDIQNFVGTVLFS